MCLPKFDLTQYDLPPSLKILLGGKQLAPPPTPLDFGGLIIGKKHHSYSSGTALSSVSPLVYSVFLIIFNLFVIL